MPAKQPNGGRTAAEVDALLPRTMLVMRGHIKAAFGLSDEDLRAMIPGVFRPAELNLPPNKRNKKAKRRLGPRQRFLRSQVLAVARRWEGGV
jgi:hypothetical protein